MESGAQPKCARLPWPSPRWGSIRCCPRGPPSGRIGWSAKSPPGASRTRRVSLFRGARWPMQSAPRKSHARAADRVTDQAAENPLEEMETLSASRGSRAGFARAQVVRQFGDVRQRASFECRQRIGDEERASHVFAPPARYEIE